MRDTFYVYIATNKTNKVLYTGVTNDLARRIAEHKNGAIEGFTQKYKVNKLVFYEIFSSPEDAIAAEKRIKGWLRRKKIALVDSKNTEWKDLSSTVS